ncbi:NADH:flavin oxidoreductase [Kibdelosporangium phytohabitans]|uniref:NADH:flavin oxidoreductase n=2 Tax=Kibdelosporangium phytohabitans TaxID=860235 RepID=A0A0N9I5C1_9PSEU|nr:NADH:flavin oxidoreductase [Kibdelosporangium phytohabitans]ALG15274.1 NADH:flavin oxidoreductase [Kibdelosporangium phytohabitans]
MNTIHPALTPTRIGAHELRSRYAVAPMSRVSATPDGVPTAEMAQYYKEFADGGFPLVITEGTYVDTRHSQGYLNQPGLATDRHVEGWRPVTAGVHAAGGLMITQLMHAGALSQGNPYTDERIGPSAVRPRGVMLPEYGGSGSWPVPREMSTQDIDDVVAGFVAATHNAVAAGFDGVEIHAANGYLFDQFITDYTNKRTDSYGGPMANRVRLTVQVLDAIKATGVLVGVRLSQTKVNDFTYRWPDAERDAETIYTALAHADYLHIASEGRNWLDTATLANGRTVTSIAREVTGLPVIVNGGMHDTALAAKVLDGGHADVLSVARGALVNPDLPRRVAAGAELERFEHGMLDPMVTIGNARRWKESRQG